MLVEARVQSGKQGGSREAMSCGELGSLLQDEWKGHVGHLGSSREGTDMGLTGQWGGGIMENTPSLLRKREKEREGAGESDRLQILPLFLPGSLQWVAIGNGAWKTQFVGFAPVFKIRAGQGRGSL